MANKRTIWKVLADLAKPKPKKEPEYTFLTFQGKVDKVADGELSKLAERKAKLDGMIAEQKAKIKVWEEEVASIKPWLSTTA